MTRFLPILLALCATGLFAQNPVPRLVYEERGGTAGRSLVVDGKTFGPYKEVNLATKSTSGTAGLFFTNKRDKTYVVAQGREWGPLATGENTDASYISDDGKLWALTTSHDVPTDKGDVKDGDDGGDADADADAETVTQTTLWVNGKTYGPFESVYDFQYAETGGSWIATVKVADDAYAVLLNGKNLGSFSSVDHIWMFPDGKDWGYVFTDQDSTTVVMSAKKYEAVQSYDFNSMYPKSAHWAYAVSIDDENELIVIDGKTYPGYINFNGLSLSTSSRHWAFEAEKLSNEGDHPVIVVDGKEYLGESLSSSSLGDKEYFLWEVKDGTKVTTQVLALP